MATALAGADWHLHVPADWTPAQRAAFQRIVDRQKEQGVLYGASVLGGWLNAYMHWPARVAGQQRHEVNGHIWYTDTWEMIPCAELEAGADEIPKEVQRWLQMLDDPARDW
jgi:hypothetical protein